ncbi:MAG: hypothetical protein LH702_29815 [Phormidesmis sp. CAN_BIN44]|nr:hypothetical protein [Phormidesmis sp. CAN_BIN44]
MPRFLLIRQKLKKNQEPDWLTPDKNSAIEVRQTDRIQEIKLLAKVHALIPQPLLPSLGEGEPDFKVPPKLGRGI